MNRFDLLVLGNAVIALVALYRLHVCTLLLAGNNTLVSLSLASIQRYGPPVSQSFLPVYVFSDENLATASVIMAISLASLLGFTIIAVRRRVRIGPDAPAVPKPVLIAIAIYLVVFAVATKTIFSGAYLTQEKRYNLEVGGLHALLCGLVIYELVRRRLLFAISARKAFLVILAIFVATGYSKGVVGATTGYILVSGMLMLPHSGAARRLHNMARIAVAMGIILFLSLMVRAVRGTLGEQGTDAVATFVQGVSESEAQRETSGQGLEATANAPQSATHILECVTIYDGGSSRDWRSIYNVVEYTFKPSFLLRTFGWERSREAAWEIGDYFPGGGGINVLGEFYWNGGFLCVVIMATALSFFCFALDKTWRASPFSLLMLTQFAPSFLMGYGYGFAQVSRGAINGLLVTAVYKAISILREGRQIARGARLASAPVTFDGHPDTMNTQ